MRWSIHQFEKKRNAAFIFGSYRKFWQFQTVCSKVFSRNGWAMLKSDSPVRPMRPAQRKKRAVGGVMNFTPIFFPKEEVVGNLKLLSCVQHPRWFQECSSEVSWRAEVFSEISVISSARLGWDDVRVEIAISNLGIQQYNCTISDWSMTFSSKSFWRFLVIYLWTCGILQLYFLDIVLPKAGFQQPRPSREAFSSSSGCSLLFLDPCRYCSVREMPW